MLIVFIAAAVVVSFFTQWNDVVEGAYDGFYGPGHVTATR